MRILLFSKSERTGGQIVLRPTMLSVVTLQSKLILGNGDCREAEAVNALDLALDFIFGLDLCLKMFGLE